jgi:undecaprenyl-diphosphatase
MAALTAILEAWNRAVFLGLNAPDHPAPILVAIAIDLAQWTIFLVPVLLAGMWLWSNRGNRPGLLLTFCGGELALGINQIAAMLWYHPRPFAVPIGRTLVEHVADSSFPSDHITFLVAIGLGLQLWTESRWAGAVVLALAVPVAWARLFIGVHFPLDMLGAVPVAIVGLLLVLPFRRWAERTLLPRLAEPLYRRIFAGPIARGWVRP